MPATCSTALPVDRIPCRFGVDQRELAMITHGKAGNRIVHNTAVRGDGEIWRSGDRMTLPAPSKELERALPGR